MNLSKDSKERVEYLASKFTKNRPVLCEYHQPDGLPIDENQNIKSQNHPSVKFNKIVRDEVNAKRQTMDIPEYVIEYNVRLKLKNIFSSKYNQKADSRACVKCYRNRIESDCGVPIRIELPEKYKNISQ